MRSVVGPAVVAGGHSDVTPLLLETMTEATRQMTRLVSRHLRLLISTGVAIVMFFLLPTYWAAITRVLVSWNVGVIMFLTWVFWLMANQSATQISERYQDEDETAPVILIISIIAAIF